MPRTKKCVLRNTAVTAALIGALALAGCSSTGGSGSGSGSSARHVATGNTGTMAQFTPISQVCGTKSVTVGLIDGYGTNTWSKTVKAEVDSEAAKCKVIKAVQYQAARGDIQAQNSAVTGMAAKGVKIILVVPDAGPGQAGLQAIAKATKAGSIVIPIASDPTGKDGDQYLDYVDWVPEYSGETWAKWMVDQLGSKGGNVVMLGGPAGNAVSAGELVGIKKVLASNPKVKLLTSTPVTTNWDPAQSQQAMSGLLSKYSKIDGIISDYGATSEGAIRAYQAAGVSLPPIATTDDNSLSCGYAALKAKYPTYALATVSSRTWIGRVGLRKGLAAFEGKANKEPSLYNLGLFEDSSGKAAGSKTPQKACLSGAPSDATPSSLLTLAETKQLLG